MDGIDNDWFKESYKVSNVEFGSSDPIKSRDTKLNACSAL